MNKNFGASFAHVSSFDFSYIRHLFLYAQPHAPSTSGLLVVMRAQKHSAQVLLHFQKAEKMANLVFRVYVLCQKRKILSVSIFNIHFYIRRHMTRSSLGNALSRTRTCKVLKPFATLKGYVLN